MHNPDMFYIVAVILFVIAGIMRLMSRAFDSALVAFGLAFFAYAFVIDKLAV